MTKSVYIYTNITFFPKEGRSLSGKNVLKN